jgi:RNA polymerase sigma-70 factor (ECF subfamily)
MTGCAGSADGGPPQHGAWFPAEAKALAVLPDSDILCALRDLPYDLRLAVYLADVEGYQYTEIAEIMGTPVGTVVSRLHRGRRKLRDLLALFAAARGLAAAPSVT